MSDVTFTITIDETMCTCLEELRLMGKTRDYSSLLAVVERIQQHGNRMEEALWRNRDKRNAMRRILKDKDLTDKQRIKAIRKELKE